MRVSLKRMSALIIAVLLAVAMSPAGYAASNTKANIKLAKSKVNITVGESVKIAVDYQDVEAEADDFDSSRVRVFVDKSDVVEVQFDGEGSDLSAIVITGIADGETQVSVKAGRYIGQCRVIVGRGNKSPEQAKKEEKAKKAEEDAIKNDKSELGKALDEALKKSIKKEVMITTTSKKDSAIPVTTLMALASKARQAKKYAIVRVSSFDSTGKVNAQMFVDPAGLSFLKSDFKTGITIDSSRKASVGSNYIASVKCAQTGSLGIFTEIAVKVNGPKDASNISVYNVDSKGKFKLIEEPSCSWDKNGLLHFYTKSGGEIVLVKGRQTTAKTEEKTKNEVVEFDGKVSEN